MASLVSSNMALFGLKIDPSSETTHDVAPAARPASPALNKGDATKIRDEHLGSDASPALDAMPASDTIPASEAIRASTAFPEAPTHPLESPATSEELSPSQ